MNQKQQQRTKKEWLSLIEEWKQSKLSAKQFCKQRTIPYSTFIGKCNRFSNVMRRIDDHPYNRLAELLPDRWAKERNPDFDGQSSVRFSLLKK